MAKVTLERKAHGMATVRRNAVKPGQIFQIVMRDGALGKNKYIALGNNGKLYSVNTANGALASTATANKKVTVVGTANLKTHFLAASEQRKTSRGNVRSGEIFQAAGDGREKSYLALGSLTDGRYASVNMANPFDHDYAVTGNGKRNVVVIGTAEFVGKVV